jgi:hypothetical protein
LRLVPGDGLDHVVGLVIDPEGGFVDVDGDGPAGVTQPDLDTLADDLGAAAAGHGVLHSGGALVKEWIRTGSAGALEAGALFGRCHGWLQAVWGCGCIGI